MVRNQLCQRCWNHKPRARRLCEVCGRRVGSGCFPEHCLMVDAYEGRGQPSICRDCWPGWGPAPVSKEFNDIWNIMASRGF